MQDRAYLNGVEREMSRLKSLADLAIAQQSEEAFFARSAESENSVAIVVKHVAGNMHSRWRAFLTSDGEKPDRNRDDEFVLTPADSRDALQAQWDSGWHVFLATLSTLSDQDLDRNVTIRGEPLSVLQAIARQHTHYAYHVGQIVFLAKQHSGENWRSLSIAKGQSVRFNENPTSYL